MFADRNCFKPAMKLFFGFVLAASFLCARAPAQQLTSCTVTNPSTPCIQKFVDPRPIPPFLTATPVTVGTSPADGYQIAAREILQQVLSTGTNDINGNQLMTAVFAYGTNGFPYSYSAPTRVCSGPTDTNCFFYPAPIIKATTGMPVQVKWIDDITCHAGDTQPQFNNCTPGNFLPYPGVHNAGGVNPSFTNHTANPSGICNGKSITPSDCQGVGGYTGPVPFVVHLHGTVAGSDSDGIPESWSSTKTSSFNMATFPQTHGDDYRQTDANGVPTTAYSGDGASLYLYRNRQFGTLLFFHDHALGVTTENVYMGLAGPYVLAGTHRSPATWCNGDCTANPFDLTDDLPDDSDVPGGLHGMIPLVITDKAFNTNGSLKFSENGNVIVVNGKTWPYLNVEPRKYRFRLVIGAPTSRFDLTFPSANNDHPGTPVATMTQIGADQGYLPHPAKATKVSLMPGERADVIVDFSSFFSCVPPYSTGCPTTVDLLNANGSGDTGTIMRFNIVSFAGCDLNNPDPAACTPFGADTSCNLSFLSCTPADTLPHRICAQGNPASNPAGCANPPVRQVSLFDDHLSNCTNLGCVGSMPLPWDGKVTETPRADATEIWEMYDFQDSHPMHLHLAEFEVINRENMSTHKVYNCTGMAMNAQHQMVPCSSPPVPGETGFKDTVQANAGQITRVRVQVAGPDKSTYPGLFAWHCHINPHEDNEMMRPICVEDVVNPGASACLQTR